MMMTPGSWKIYKVAFWERDDKLHQAYVTADMLEIGRDWPTTIQDGKSGSTFKFASNEVMEDWMIGNYSGHARYVEVKDCR